MVVLEKLTRPELERLIERGVRTAVIPFGSVEDHGGHLPLGADALLADAVGRAVSARLDAVLAPTVRVGCAGQHMGGAGTLTVSSEALRETAVHTARSLAAHGFRMIVFVSAHGGNQAALEEAVDALNAEYGDVLACAPRGDIGPDLGMHSGRWLTSVLLSLHPDLVDAGAAGPEIADEIAGATPEAGAANLERFVAAIVRKVPRSRTNERSP